MKLIDKIKLGIIGIYGTILFEINSIRNTLRFKRARRKADKMHELTGRRYHVIAAADNKLVVVDNNFVKYYNKKTKGPKITIDKLIEMSYYSTSVEGITRKKMAKTA